MILALWYAYMSITKKVEFSWLWMIGTIILDTAFVHMLIWVITGIQPEPWLCIGKGC